MAVVLDDNEIISLVDSEVNGSSSYYDSEISTQRERAMEYFYGEPFGNEEEGRSQVVVTDVQDTIMWMMPSLMRIFTAGENVVEFVPEGPEDVAVAEQATNYVNHVFYKQNDGFMILYNLFLDALMQKVGIVKHYWEELQDTTTESYDNLTQGEYDSLLNDEDLELQEHTETVTERLALDPSTGQPVTVQDVSHEAVFSRTSFNGKVTIENVPPEEFLINRGAKSIADARFICHRSHKSRNDLIRMGYDEEIVSELPTYVSGADDITTSQEYMARHSYDSTGMYPNQAAVDSEAMVQIFESYLKLDLEDDGISVLHKVTHSGNTILDLEPIDYIPFSSVCPIPIPHKFFGLSVAETVQDIQLIRSTLTRNLLDNMYLANNGRFQVVEGQVNIDDLLTNRPGGIVRTRSQGALQPIATPALQPAAFQMLEYWEGIKTGRTGVNPKTQGLSADVLKSHVTTGAVQGALTNSQGRLELIARIFADTGVRNMFRSIYNLIQRYEDRKKVVRVNNKYQEIDASSWRENMDVDIKVGIGYGDQNNRMNNLSAFSGMIEKVANQTEGIVSPDNVYNLVRQIGKEMGINNIDALVTPPPPERTEPNLQEQAVQAQSQALVMEAQASQTQAQVKVKELELKAARLELDRVETEYDIALKQEELKLKGVELGFEMASGENVKA